MSHIEVIFPIILACIGVITILASKKPVVMLPPPAGPEALGPMRQMTYTQPITPAPDLTTVSPNAGLCAVRIVAIGTNKIQAIKTIRGCRLGIGLNVAKGLTENLPQPLFRDLPAADAERVRRYLSLGGGCKW